MNAPESLEGWQAAKATSLARMFTVELVNDVSSY